MLKKAIAHLERIKGSLDEKTPYWLREGSLKKVNRRIVASLLDSKRTGVLEIWRGRSLFDGKAIKIVMQGYCSDSENGKTGSMVQLSIMPVEESPYTGFKAKSATVCGACKYNGQGCYVQWARYDRWLAGSTPSIPFTAALSILKGLRVRIGTAGDPAAVPFHVWEAVMHVADGTTGYTHAWKDCDQRLKHVCMASCDSLEETKQAIEAGWSVFYVLDVEDKPPAGAVQCQFTASQVQCIDCMLCTPLQRDAGRKVIYDTLHGATNTLHAARKARAEGCATTGKGV